MKVFLVTPKGGAARLVEAAGPKTARNFVAQDIEVREVKGRELITKASELNLESVEGRPDPADVHGEGSAEAEAAARGDKPE